MVVGKSSGSARIGAELLHTGKEACRGAQKKALSAL
jgi:hypothetical protein